MQFTVCRRNEEGKIEVIPDLLTPSVPGPKSEAMNHPDIISFCEQHDCTIYDIVR